ncbi:MAG TPA: hypothetical protein PKE51_06705 [Gemmatimonadaceae bacterium]|nr:hypothetical protein [Gemmatimonadaceae bacterium]
MSDSSSRDVTGPDDALPPADPSSTEAHAGTPLDDEAASLAAILPQLDAARGDLLALHRVLLHAERVRYEKLFGRINGNGAFLQLALHDPWFTWLRPMMKLVSEIDSRLLDRGQAPITSAEAGALLAEARRLLRPDAEGSGFQQEFQQLLQDSPEVAVLHGQLVRGRS